MASRFGGIFGACTRARALDLLVLGGSGGPFATLFRVRPSRRMANRGRELELRQELTLAGYYAMSGTGW